MRIGRKEVLRLGVEVGEIAASAARDEDLLSEAIGVIEERDAAVATSSFYGAHEAGCAAAENECVEGSDHVRDSLPQAVKPRFITLAYRSAERSSYI